jgi:hypothetical protein
MKRNHTLAVLLILVAIIGFGCGKEGPSNNSIIGTWRAISIKDVSVDSSVTPYVPVTHDSTFSRAHSLTVQFNSDSSFVSVDNTQSPPGGGTGKYYVTGDSLYEFDSGGSGYVYDGTYIVAGNSFKLLIASNVPGYYSDVVTVSFARQY